VVRVCEDCASLDMDQGIQYTRPGTMHRECSQCHFEYCQSTPANEDPYEELSLLGCPKCYSEFREELISTLRRIHGSIKHRGKVQTSKNRERKAKSEKTHVLKSMPYAPFAKAEWMQGSGPDRDVIISTRVRLARNVSGHAFCGQAQEAELKQIAATVENALVDMSGYTGSPLKNASIIRLSNLDPVELEFLVERHLISRDLAEKNESGEVIVGEKEVVSIMLNEEDHIRLQVITPGLQLTQSWEMVNAIDDELARRVDYAFSTDWGYLTACPTNVGTGLRISVMFHIPALAATREGNRILSSISDMGYAIRGMYGEGSQAIGAFYQISNETTLGQSEAEIIERIRSVARQLVDREREERRILIEKNGIELEDKIFRSYGILVNARLISSREALDLLSWVSLGVNTGMLLEECDIPVPRDSQNTKMVKAQRARRDGDPEKERIRGRIAQLLVLIRPAHLQKYEGRKLDTELRDIARAAVTRALIKGDA
jgi:protein arginine kinase